MLSSCSSSNDSGMSISGPKSVEITAKHEEFTVQFSKIAGIGVDDNQVFPKFEFFINEEDNIGSAKKLYYEENNEKIDYIQQPNDMSGLMRQFVKPQKTDNDGDNIVLLYPIKDTNRYYLWVRACFDGYGCSDYAKTDAIPVPYPTKLKEGDVEVIEGDKTLLIKIKNANLFDEYGVLADKLECDSPELPKIDPVYTTSNDNLVITSLKNYTDDSETGYKVCIRAQNINTDKNNPETVSWLQLGEMRPKASTQPPATPDIQLVSEGNKRVTFKFTGDYEGENAVSEYKVIYNGNNKEEEEVIVTDTYNIEHTIINLVNGKNYNIKVKSKNSKGESESNEIKATPKDIPIDFNNLDTVLGKTSDIFVYAEDIPHSDFWRIDSSHKKGGRPSTDRLPRGKETALGNLWSDAVNYYVKEKLKENVDFTVLVGEMIGNGMEKGVSITPRLLMKLTPIDYIDDTIVIAELKGSDLIENADYLIDLKKYPVLDTRKTLFGQAAAIHRVGHYGTTAQPAAYATKAWLMPSEEVKYTIEYLPYSLEEFNDNFEEKCGNVADFADYDSKIDPRRCYLIELPANSNDYSFYYPEDPNIGYIRGKIKEGSLTIDGQPINANKTYRIATTKKIADQMYVAFLKAKIKNTNTLLWKAIAEYIYDTGTIEPKLDGRVKIKGGVPTDTKNDFKE